MPKYIIYIPGHAYEVGNPGVKNAITAYIINAWKQFSSFVFIVNHLNKLIRAECPSFVLVSAFNSLASSITNTGALAPFQKVLGGNCALIFCKLLV